MPTPDFTLFKTAYVCGLPHAEFLDLLKKAEAWVALPLDEANAALQANIQRKPRELYQALNIVGLKIQKELGIIPGPAANAQLQAIFAKVGQGGGSEDDRRLTMQLWTDWRLLGELLKIDPTLSQPVPPGDLAKAEVQKEATAIFERLSRQPSVTPGSVSSETIEQLKTILGDYTALAEKTPKDNPALLDVYYGIGHVELSLVKSLLIVGKNEEAVEYFKKSAESFSQAGHPEKTAMVLKQLREFQQNVSGQLDESAAENLGALTAENATTDPIARITSLINLTNVAAASADIFEALRTAEMAVKEIEALGYADPSKLGNDKAVSRWISTATETLTGVPLLGRLQQVGTWYLSIYSARYADWIRRDPAAAEALLAVQVQMENSLSQIGQCANEAAVERDREMRHFFPSVAETAPTAPTAKEADHEVVTGRMRDVDTKLSAIRERCNQRIGTGIAMDDLLAELKALELAADSLKTPIYETKVRLEQVYVLGHLGRAADILSIARDARQRLLAGRPASLSSFSQSFERIAYLETWRGEANAYIMLKDFENLLATSETVIRDFETGRYRVNNPYRTTAVLSTVADFYLWATFAAFKLERWDNMLDAIELIKARSAVHNRLLSRADSPETAPTLDALIKEFNELSAALSKNPGDLELTTRRRQIWDLLSFTRSKFAASQALPDFNLKSVQASLAQDEALIGYFWLGEKVILTMTVDRDRFQVVRLILEDADFELTQNFSAFMRGLKSAAGRGFDQTIERLGKVFLPPQVRDFIKAKDRVIISPHRNLHLFPFHAARWSEKEYFGTHFAIRYVPNFSSLLLPWAGRNEKSFFGFAIKDFAQPGIPALGKVEDDLDEILKLYSENGTQVLGLKGGQATRENLFSNDNRHRLKNARCLHFGTHGLSVFESPNEPMEAKLLLQDSSLDCMDIAQLELSAEIAVLSACDSGQRSLSVRGFNELPGDDIFGLQAALFQAGVRCVLGTLWLVETESSSAIVKAFHRHYASKGESDLALRAAIREYLADPTTAHSAFYWAPYFLSCMGASQSASTIAKM